MLTRSKKSRQQCALPPDPLWTLTAPSSHWQWLSPSLSALRRHDPNGRLSIGRLLLSSIHRVCSWYTIDSSSSNKTAIPHHADRTPGLFRASSLSNSFNFPRYTTCDPVIIISKGIQLKLLPCISKVTLKILTHLSPHDGLTTLKYLITSPGRLTSVCFCVCLSRWVTSEKIPGGIVLRMTWKV